MNKSCESVAVDRSQCGADVPSRQRAWRVLSVDDDDGFRASLAFTIEGSTILGFPVEVLEARSYAEAAAVLTREDDIATILLDVVMETDDAGLRLVRAVRDVLGNEAVRIVLLSGQLGMEPLADVMREYDINDCWTKAELTADRLHTVLSASARSYAQIRTVARARRGLQLIVESTNAIFNTRSMDALASVILSEIATILDVGHDGIVCVWQERPGGAVTDLPVIGATGRYAHTIGAPLAAVENGDVVEAIERCLRDVEEIAANGHRVLPFINSVDGSVCVVYLDMARPLDATEVEMLRVFATNIRGGIHNVALVSRLDGMAYSDPLLGIANRNALMRALRLALTSQTRDDLNLVLVDIDNFSGLNLALGTVYCDNVLADVARRLREGLGSEPVIARIANDLFGVLGDRRVVDGERIVDLFSPSYASTPLELHDNISVGAVTLPVTQIDATPEQAINRAVVAMRQAKRQGIGQHRVVDPSSGDTAAERFALLSALRCAVARDDVAVVFQPQMGLPSGEPIGVEMLARWTMPDGTVVTPDVFIALAEASGLILPLGERLFEKACLAVDAIDAAGGGSLRIAVNVSPVQLAQNGLSARFLRILQSHRVAPERIEIEITESCAMGDGAVVRDNLDRLRDAGFPIAIDDFGTGFSSLASLRSLPAHRLKIDRRFVEEIGRHRDEVAIADMVIRMGNRLGMRVLAEGVETKEQAEWLAARGCLEAQGYHFARPMDLAVLCAWLRNLRTAGGDSAC